MLKPHDRGGWPTEGEIDKSNHELMDWEWLSGALAELLREKGMMSSDELRRGIECLTTKEYDELSYYERWIHSIELNLIEKGILGKQEIEAMGLAKDHRWE